MLVQRVNQLSLQTAHTTSILKVSILLLLVHIHIPRGLRTREGVSEPLVPQRHYPQHIQPHLNHLGRLLFTHR